MGPYCKFCGNRCFTHPPTGTPQEELEKYRPFHSIIISTCPGGQAYEKEKFGTCYDEILAAIKSKREITMNTVVIEVRGGVAEVTLCSKDIRVIIWDWDNLDDVKTAHEFAPSDTVGTTYGFPYERGDALAAYLVEEGIIQPKGEPR